MAFKRAATFYVLFVRFIRFIVHRVQRLHSYTNSEASFLMVIMCMGSVGFVIFDSFSSLRVFKSALPLFWKFIDIINTACLFVVQLRFAQNNYRLLLFYWFWGLYYKSFIQYELYHVFSFCSLFLFIIISIANCMPNKFGVCVRTVYSVDFMLLLLFFTAFSETK